VVAHEAGGELHGDVALSTSRCCNIFCLMLHDSIHVATIVFYVPYVVFLCCNLHIPMFHPVIDVATIVFRVLFATFSCCDTCASMFHSD
jgi:hypothetical protein